MCVCVCVCVQTSLCLHIQYCYIYYFVMTCKQASSSSVMACDLIWWNMLFMFRV